MSRKKKNSSPKIRSFIAISLPEELKESLGEFQARLKKAQADVKWVRPASLHITLRFLGYLTPEEVEKAGKALEKVAQKFSPFTIQLEGYGTFPERGRPRVIWTGITLGKDQLAQISQQLEKCLDDFGFPPADKPFSPHLTLGRIKTGKNLNNLIEYLNKEGNKIYGKFLAKSIILFKSELRPEGARYSVIKQVGLGNLTEG